MSKGPRRPTADPLATMQRMIDAEYSGALGESRQASNRVGQRFSRVYSAAASNLLDKAVVRLRRGDEAAARAFVGRALDLPYDDHEKVVPALWQVHMMLFDAFGDDVEAAEPTDLGWLNRIESVVGEAEGPVQRELRSCLLALFDMALSSKEQRRLRLVVRDVDNDEPFVGITDREERLDVVIGMLRALIRHEDLVDEAVSRS